MLRAVAIVIALIAALAYAPAAFAHASLIRAEPADGAMLGYSPDVLKLTFNEPVSPLVIRIIDPSGEVIAPAVSAENTVVTVTPPRLRNGTHVLSWRVISADGHPVGGSLLFSVGAPSGEPAPVAVAAADPAVRAGLWTAKVVIYIGLLFGIGAAFFRAWISDSGSAAGGRLTLAMLVAGLAATPASVGFLGLDAFDLPLSGLAQKSVWMTGLETSYGLTAMATAFALLAGIFTFAAPSAGQARAWSLAALLGVGVAFALSGHASTASPQWLTRPSVFLHGVCVAFWLGALPPLVLTIRAPGGDGALVRFSRAIPYPLAILIVTGLVLAVIQLESPAALWTTNYGIVLCAKVAAATALIALAACNRFVLVPRIASGAGAHKRLVATIAFEIAIAFAILGVVALWRFTPPPRALALAANQVSFHLHGERAMAQVEVELRRPRGAQITLLILDGELRPLAVKEVTLVLSNPAAGIEPVRRSAAAAGDATWRIENLAIPVAGRWSVRVEILISDFEKATLEDSVLLPRSP